MVEIDSDGSLVLDSPQSMERQDKLAKAKAMEDNINHMRHRKVVEDSIKSRREAAQLNKKLFQLENNKKNS